MDRIRITPDAVASMGMTRRGLFKRSAALGLSTAFFGCALSPSTGLADAPRRGGKLVAGVKGGSTTDTLDPVLMPSPVPLYVFYQFGSRLLDRATDGSLESGLAETWEVLDDAKRWIFKLRRDVQFHNGKAFTASDMVYSLNRHRGPDSNSGAAPLLKGIEEVRADGQHELTVLLNAPDVNFPYLMSNAQLIAQPEGEEPDRGIGTGPYVVESAEPGVRYAFRRNPNYFKAELPWFDELEILVINDDAARVSALLSGSAHLATEITPVLVGRLENAPDVVITSAASTKFYYFVMRCDMPPFDNRDLRLALKYAVDRETILRNALAGYGSLGNDNPINSIYPLYSGDIPKHGYDPDKAQFYYKKSGYSGSIILHTSDGAFPGTINAAEVFQQSAAKAGIEIEVRREPADGYWSDVWRNKPFCASYFGSLATEDQAFTQPYASDSPWNDAYWQRPEFDALLAKARSELDVVQRKALYREAARMIHDDGGHIIFMFADAITGLSSKVRGFIGDHFHGDAKNTERCWFES